MASTACSDVLRSQRLKVNLHSKDGRSVCFFNMHDLFKASQRANTLQARLSLTHQFALDITLHLFLNIAKIDKLINNNYTYTS